MKKCFLFLGFIALCLSAFSVNAQSDKANSELSLEVVGVTVVPHYVSGEIPNYPSDEKYLSKFKPGANVRIFVKNTGKETITPTLLLNGKNGQDLLTANQVSYCDLPDTREAVTKMSTSIPEGGMDSYVFNVVNRDFYANGVTLKFADKETGKTLETVVEIKSPELFVSRILFHSSEGSVFPDGFYVYFNNETNKAAQINRVKLWKPGKTWVEHAWTESFEPKDIEWFGEKGNIPAGEINGALVSTGKLAFGETIIEFEVSSNSVVEKMYYVVKPLVINFDLGLGWDFEKLSKSEAYAKTLKYMHFNTVNSAAVEFLAKKELAEKYPMKRFSNLKELAATTDENELKTIHGSESFGEPQFEKKSVQGIYNHFTTFRNSGFPSTLTLSHEPGFYHYAGVVDFNHFDAYRVTAPHADKWGNYKKYGKKNVKWGSPLETIGDYMRTLNRINYPNPIAAWTQGMADDWTHHARKEAGNPNNLEMRIQAYEAVANGASSLYWFNLGGKTVINNRSSLAEIQRINRELMVVGELLSKSNPFWWENRFLDLDLNALAGPDFTVLFAIDLKYEISKANQFVSAGKRTETMYFKIPAYLNDSDKALKVTSEGISEVSVQRVGDKAAITDTFENTGMYILYNSKKSNLKDLLISKYNGIMKSETLWQFDPITNDSDFEKLVEEVNLANKN